MLPPDTKLVPAERLFRAVQDLAEELVGDS
jgi:hypothetical protein